MIHIKLNSSNINKRQDSEGFGFGSCAHRTYIFCTVVALTKKVQRSYYFYSYHDSNLDFFVYSVVVTKGDD